MITNLKLTPESNHILNILEVYLRLPNLVPSQNYMANASNQEKMKNFYSFFKFV